MAVQRQGVDCEGVADEVDELAVSTGGVGSAQPAGVESAGDSMRRDSLPIRVLTGPSSLRSRDQPLRRRTGRRG